MTADGDIDDVVVERLLAGDRHVHASWAEIDAAIVHLSVRGLNRMQIARRLGITDKTVYRHELRRRQLMEG